MAAVNNTHSLKNFGFYQADTSMPKRIIMAVNGHRGAGKSHFALTAPGPIAVFNFDVGLSGVVQKFAANKVVMVTDMRVPNVQEEAAREWQRFCNAWTMALKAKDVRTVVIDAETESYELIRLGRFGQLSQVMPYMYGPVSAEYARVLRQALDADKNVVLTRHLRSVYINDKKTRDFEPAGFSGVEKIVEAVVEIRRQRIEDGRGWEIEITKNRLNPELDGEVLGGDACNFPFLASLCIEGTPVDAWT
jgi:hypothetical protein